MMSSSMPLTPTMITRGLDLDFAALAVCWAGRAIGSKNTEAKSKEILRETIEHPFIWRG